MSRHLVTAAIEAPLQGVISGLSTKVQGGNFPEGFKSGATGALAAGAQRSGSASGIIPRFGESGLSELGEDAISHATKGVLLNEDPVNGALLGLYGHALGSDIVQTDMYQKHERDLQLEWWRREIEAGRVPLYVDAESRKTFREGLAEYRAGTDRSLAGDLSWMARSVPHIVDRWWERTWHPADNPALVKPYSNGEFNQVQDIPDRANQTIRETP